MPAPKQPRDIEPAGALLGHPLSLDEAYVALQGFLTSSARWYLSKKTTKRRWARALRLLTIIAVVLGGLAPVIGTLWTEFPISLGFVLLGLAGGFQLLDRAYGFSGGWSRSLGAALSLEACSTKLALEYSRLKARGPESDEMWQLLVAGSNEAWQIIASETSTWLSEFEAVMEEVRGQVSIRSDNNASSRAE